MSEHTELRIGRQVGGGGTATVHLATTRTGVEVAAKVFPTTTPPTRIRWEAMLASRFDHPNVVRVLGVDESGPCPVLVTEWAPRGSLAELIVARGQLSPGETMTVAWALADVLLAAAGLGIVHGDLCAANIVFGADGRPMVIDFGAARMAGDTMTPVSVTPTDLAPEVARGELPGPASDLFGLGSVLLQCLTGRPAWSAVDARDVVVQATVGQWPDPGSGELAELVRALLHEEPGRRPDPQVVLGRLRKLGRPLPLQFPEGTNPITAPAGAHTSSPHPADPEPAAQDPLPTPATPDRRSPQPVDQASPRPIAPAPSGGRHALSEDPATDGTPESEGPPGPGTAPAAPPAFTSSAPPSLTSLPPASASPTSALPTSSTPASTSSARSAPRDPVDRSSGPAPSRSVPGPVDGTTIAPPTVWPDPSGVATQLRHRSTDSTPEPLSHPRRRAVVVVVAASVVILLIAAAVLTLGGEPADDGTTQVAAQASTSSAQDPGADPSAARGADPSATSGPVPLPVPPDMSSSSGPDLSPAPTTEPGTPSPDGPSPDGPSPDGPGGPTATTHVVPPALAPPTSAAAPSVLAPPTSAPSSSAASDVTMVVGDPSTEDWLPVVTELDSRRAHALRTRDPDFLALVYVLPSVPAEADGRTIRDLVATERTLTGAEHRVLSASWQATDADGSVRLAVTDELPAYAILSADGTEVGRTTARGAEDQVMVLVPTPEGFRIRSVGPA